MRSLCRDALAPKRPAGLFGRLRRRRPVTWSYIHVGAVRGRLPAPDQYAGQDSLVLDSLAGQVTASIRHRDGAFVWPLDVENTESESESGAEIETSPISLWFWDGDPMRLEIRLHWSLWADPGSPGRDQVDKALTRLAHAGWKLAPDAG